MFNNYLQAAKQSLDEKDILNIEQNATQFADKIFSNHISNANLKTIFSDLKNQIDSYLESEEHKIVKAQCFYYYFSNQIFENLRLEKSNPLKMRSFGKISENKLNTETKQFILYGLKYGAPDNEHTPIADFFEQKKQDALSKKENYTANYDEHGFSDLKWSIHLDIFSGMIHFSNQHNDDKERKIDYFLNIFKENDFLTQVIGDNNKVKQKRKI